jgi:pimeloyl-ACP methyl ester carboxylesterase
VPFADNQGRRIHYQTEGQGPPVVLHHWSLSALESWYDYGYVSALKNEYRLILPDACGHGASDKPHSPEAYELPKRVGDVVAVLDDLGIAQAHFFGYSMGGWIGFGVARYAPDRFRSLIIGGQHPYAQSMEGLRQLVRYGVENGPQAFVAMWEESFGALLDQEKARMLSYDYDALLAVAQDRDSLEAVLPTMRIPCLLFVGEADGVCPLARQCAQRIANVQFVVLPGLDHGEAIAQRDQVVPLVKEFLAAADQRRDTARAPHGSLSG